MITMTQEEKLERARELVRSPRTAGDWRAALVILTSETFAHDGRVWSQVDLQRGSIYFEKMLEDGTFSGGEMRLAKIAASLFSPRFKVALWEVFGGLDEDNTRIALQAMAVYCGLEVVPMS
jgi:hypothetical protein